MMHKETNNNSSTVSQDEKTYQVNTTDIEPYIAKETTSVSSYTNVFAQEIQTDAIGQVETAEGNVTALSADGVSRNLSAGDPVFEGDVIQTAAASSIGITFVDESTFALDENGEMTLDEMVYDPDNGSGQFASSITSGVFSFVSGQIAKVSPDAMTIDTPVATIGIRGTKGVLDVNFNEGLEIILLQEANGFVGELTVTNLTGTTVLNQANQFTTVFSFTSSPTQPIIVDNIQIFTSFGSQSINVVNRSLASAAQRRAERAQEEALDAATAAAAAAIASEEAALAAEEAELAAQEALAEAQAAEGEEAEALLAEAEALIAEADALEALALEAEAEALALAELALFTAQEAEDAILTASTLVEAQEAFETQLAEIQQAITSQNNNETSNESNEFEFGGEEIEVELNEAQEAAIEEAVEDILNVLIDDLDLIDEALEETPEDEEELPADEEEFEEESATTYLEEFISLSGPNFTSGSDIPLNEGVNGSAVDNNINGGLGEDVLVGQGGSDTLDGGDGIDILYGDVAPDTGQVAFIYDELGNPTIQNLTGYDEIFGNTGDDTAFGGNGGDLLFGFTDDSSYGASSLFMDGSSDYSDNDALYGEGGDDIIMGEYGNDFLDGGTGNDILDGGVGSDTIDGGAGIDTFILEDILGNSTAYTITINGAGSGNVTNDQDSDTDTFSNIEFIDLQKSSEVPADDEIIVNNLDGLNVAVNGGRGTDTITFGAGIASGSTIDLTNFPFYERFEVIDLQDNNLNLSINLLAYQDIFSNGIVTINGGSGTVDLNNDFLLDNSSPTAGYNTYKSINDETILIANTISVTNVTYFDQPITSNPVNSSQSYGLYDASVTTSTLTGLDQNDIIVGGGGIDTINGGAGNDIMHGGDPTGESIFEKLLQNAALVATPLDLTADGDDVLNGGDGNDILFGGDGSDELNGDDGNDILYGKLGSDVLDGGLGDDFLDGGTGNDILNDDEGRDEFIGGQQSDTFNAIQDSDYDTFAGDSGNDTLDFSGFDTAAEITFTDDDTGYFMDGVANDFSGTETFELTNLNDTIVIEPNGYADSISANDGDDTFLISADPLTTRNFLFQGDEGNDTFTLDTQADNLTSTLTTLSGGVGEDTFNVSNVDQLNQVFFLGGDDIDTLNINNSSSSGDIDLLSNTNFVSIDIFDISGQSGVDNYFLFDSSLFDFGDSGPMGLDPVTLTINGNSGDTVELDGFESYGTSSVSGYSVYTYDNGDTLRVSSSVNVVDTYSGGGGDDFVPPN